MSKKQTYKSWRITYFTGDFFSAAGEQIHTTIINARSEDEAEMIFTDVFGKGKHLAMIEEVPKKSKKRRIDDGYQT